MSAFKLRRCRRCREYFYAEYTPLEYRRRLVYCAKCAKDYTARAAADAEQRERDFQEYIEKVANYPRCACCGRVIPPGAPAYTLNARGWCPECVAWEARAKRELILKRSMMGSDVRRQPWHNRPDLQAELAKRIASRVLGNLPAIGVPVDANRALVGVWCALLSNGFDYAVVAKLWQEVPPKDSICSLADTDPMSRIARGRALTLLRRLGG